ncbi:hypothetical protein [Paracoccus binzhouensis]|nr:hypothetical protein [Paracoccus binzhouensis]
MALQLVQKKKALADGVNLPPASWLGMELDPQGLRSAPCQIAEIFN